MDLKVAVLLLAVSGVRGQTGLCSAPMSVNLRFSVGSRYNTTGHHIITADLLSGHPPGGGNNGSTLEVEAATASCADSEAARLSAVAVRLPARPPEIRAVRKEIPPGYEAVSGLGVYKIHPDKKTWMDAHDACVSEGAHLMILNSQTEAELVARLCSKMTCSGLIWGGFHQFFKMGHFITVAGEPLSKSGYLTWESGEPGGSTSYCGCMFPYGKLCDVSCSGPYNFICELPAYIN